MYLRNCSSNARHYPFLCCASIIGIDEQLFVCFSSQMFPRCCCRGTSSRCSSRISSGLSYVCNPTRKGSLPTEFLQIYILYSATIHSFYSFHYSHNHFVSSTQSTEERGYKARAAANGVENCMKSTDAHFPASSTSPSQDDRAD
jgi:hypothetical protein